MTRDPDYGWIQTLKHPRPRSLAAWWREARRGHIWWPGKTYTIDLSTRSTETDD